MRACILSIGSEIMLGHITDTNASWLARDLADAGIDLRMVMQVGDEADLLLDALTRATELADVVICTGGIGPTDDDLTRETIAAFVGETPFVDPELLRELEGFFTSMGRSMPARNSKQAWTIPSATILENPVGTAPGWLVKTPAGKRIVAMPGVPREMFRMWHEQARPRILDGTGPRIIDTIILKTTGIGESDAEDQIHDLILAGDPVVATYAKDDGVHVRVTATGDNPDEVRQRRERATGQVRRILGPYIWGQDGDTLTGVLARTLHAANLRLLIHETGTGGGLTALLGSDPASARLFDADIHSEPGNGLPAPFTSDGLTYLDVALRYVGELDERFISHGALDMDVQHPNAREPYRTSWKLRGTLQEIQRRSALNAVFALNTFLKDAAATRS